MSSENQSPESSKLSAILNRARPFLRGDLAAVDPELPSLVGVLASAGAGECWHKHGVFLHHLLDVFRILHIWSAPPEVCRCGLFHSAYSNSYVNLAIFPPDTGRPDVRRVVGGPAEHLVHLFCVVPRQQIIHDDLLFHFSDAELSSALSPHEGGEFPDWRRKLLEILPPEGVRVKHIRTGEDVVVPRRLVAVFLLMTIADFSDQLFGFQDELFENENGRNEFSGNNCKSLWPGNGKPGLWVNSMSRMAALYNLIVQEEEIFIKERDQGVLISNQKMENRVSGFEHSNGSSNGNEIGDCYFDERMENIDLPIPPIFDNCTKILSPEDQIEGRDFYWEAVCGGSDQKNAEELLRKSCEKNPFVGEPHVVLGQLLLSEERYEEGKREAEVGLRLILEWGSSWDKRMTWEGWVAWARVLVMKGEEKSWPTTSWGILNLGLVK